jgi:phage baseplate assembly protein gpV
MWLDRYAAAAAACFFVSACGGGGGGVGSTPPPTFNYTAYANLTGSRNFESASLDLLSGFGPPQVTPTTNFGQGMDISYDATAGSYTVTSSGTSATFTSADVDQTQSTPEFRVYSNGSGSLVVGVPEAGDVDLTYTRIITWGRGDGGFFRQTAAIFGVNTQSGDLPRTGTASYSKISVAGSVFTNDEFYSLEESVVTFTANFGAGTVQTNINLVGTALVSQIPDQPLDTLSGSGSIATSTSSFGGTLTGTQLNGNFAGGFFGPQAQEFGYLFNVAGTVGGNTASGIGSVVGTR